MVESSTSTPYQQIQLLFLFIFGNLASGLHALQHVVEESSADYQYVFKRIKVCCNSFILWLNFRAE